MVNRTHGQRSTRLYTIWRGMKSRCYNSNHPGYKNYGGRDIRICEAWLHDFEAFRIWAHSNNYRPDLTIDRLNPDVGYCPSNCRWATYLEQQEHKRESPTKKLSYEQVAAILQSETNNRDTAVAFGVHETTISRIRRGLRRQRDTGLSPTHARTQDAEERRERSQDPAST